MLEQGQELAGGRFIVHEKIGQGTFSEVWRCERVEGGEILACKVENVPKNKNSNSTLLFKESKILNALKGKLKVPIVHYVGESLKAGNEKQLICVMDLLGKNLEDLFTECGRRFDSKTYL